MPYIQHNNPFKKKYNSPTKGTWDTMSGEEEGEASFHSYMKGYHGLDKEAKRAKFKTDFGKTKVGKFLKKVFPGKIQKPIIKHSTNPADMAK